MHLRMVPVILKEGIIASLTGGFFFDSTQTHFVNVVHLYVWILFFITPLVLYMVTLLNYVIILKVARGSVVVGLSYALAVGLFVSIIKCLIWRLHHLLDKNEPIIKRNTEARNVFRSSRSEFGMNPVENNDDDDDDSLSGTKVDSERLAIMTDIEEQCRRIGQAGLEMADLEEAAHRRISSVQNQPPSSVCKDSELNTSGCPWPVSLADAKKAEDEFLNVVDSSESKLHSKPLFAISGDYSESGDAESLHVTSTTPFYDLPDIELNRSFLDSKNASKLCGNMYQSEKNSKNVHELSVDLHNGADNLTQLETLSKPCTESSSNVLLTPINQPKLHHKSLKYPIRRQYSETMAARLAWEPTRLRPLIGQTHWASTSRSDFHVLDAVCNRTDQSAPPTSVTPIRLSSVLYPNILLPHETYPSGSMNRMLFRSSSARTEIEQYKRTLQQLKLDVSRIPPITATNCKIPKRGEDLNGAISSRPMTYSISRARSRSQRHRRALLLESERRHRVMAYLTSYPLTEEVPGTLQFAGLSLAETKVYWRRHFANTDPIRPTRCQSLRQPSDLTVLRRNFYPTNRSITRKRLLDHGRSLSLRYNHSGVLNYPPPPVRHPLRRPGSVLRLRRQQSAGSASCEIPISSAGSSFSALGAESVDPQNRTQDSFLSPPSFAVKNKPKQTSKTNSQDAEFALTDPSKDMDDIKQGEMSVDLLNKSSIPTTLTDTIQTDVEKSDGIRETAAESTSPSKMQAEDLVDDWNGDETESKLTHRPTRRLTRQHGIRRKPANSPPKSNWPGELVNAKPSEPSVAQTQCSNSDIVPEIRNVSNVPSSSTSNTQPIHTAASVDQTVDELLACLMGVQNLSKAGLTRQQCLAQLRGCADNEDAENAELDILFAVTEAAAGVADRVNSERPIRSTVQPFVSTSLQPATSGPTISLEVGTPRPVPLHVLASRVLARNPNDNTNQTTLIGSESRDSLIAPNSFPIVPANTTERPLSSVVDDDDDVRNVPDDGIQTQGSWDQNNFDSQPFPSTLHRLYMSALHPPKRIPTAATKLEYVYNLRLFPCLPFLFRIHLNRLQLGALFDRSFTTFESCLSVFTAILVSLVGYFLLSTNGFQDLRLLACCFTIAGCHYSLVKSVQPDPASPKHGYNRIIIYSRSIMFCLLATIYLVAYHLSTLDKWIPNPTLSFSFLLPDSTQLHSHSASKTMFTHVGELTLIPNKFRTVTGQMLLPLDSASMDISTRRHLWHVSATILQPQQLDQHAHNLTESMPFDGFQLYGIYYSWMSCALCIQAVCACMILIFPLLFCFGLVPQLDTILVYTLEQLDIHVFGSSGTTGLLSVVFSIFRSFLTMAISFCLCSFSIRTNNTQSLWFSGFWGVHITLCYVLSRLPSNIRLYGTLLPCGNNMLSWQDFRNHSARICSQISSRCSLFTRSRLLRKKKKKRKPRTDSTLNTWWRRWPLLIPNLSLKSFARERAAAAAAGTDSSRVPLSSNQQTGEIQSTLEVVDLEKGIGSQSRSCDINPITSWCPDSNEGNVERCSAGGSSLSRKSRSLNILICSTSTHPMITQESIKLPEEKTHTIPPPLPFSSSLEPRTHKYSHLHLSQSRHSTRSSSNSSASNAQDLQSQPFGDPILNLPNSNIALSPSQTKQTAPGTAIRSSSTTSSVHPNTVPYNSDAGHKLRLHSSSSLIMHTSRSNTLTCSTRDSDPTPDRNSDPLPRLIRASLKARLQGDLLSSLVWFWFIFGIHATNLFTFQTLQPYLPRILTWIAICLGVVLHYVWPNLRKPYPWLLFVQPPIPPHAQGDLIQWEVAYFWMCWVERNLFLPLVTMATITQCLPILISRFGFLGSSFIIILTSMKMLRNGFCASKQTYLNLFFTDLMFAFDLRHFDEPFPINYFFVSIILSKMIELSRKLHFIYVYLAPFNIVWGSVTHAVVQLGCIPHAVFMFANCILSTLLSAPLEPFMASAVFITSYVRPISFWETTHQTQRLETTNMPIAAQLRGISKQQVSGNLDGIFYEHLTRKLQRSLAGDLQLGRLGGLALSHGDVFILSMDDLNLLIHIIEVGNGFVTFQLRGLEFIGTLCHASETETLRSDPHTNKPYSCCGCKPPRGMLSLNAAISMRCIAWQFTYIPYSIEGYQVTDHSAGLTFQLTNLRKVLVNRFVHCIIYYVAKVPDLSSRLDTLTSCLDSNRFSSDEFFDLDPVFFKAVDDDFDDEINGVTRRRFVEVYMDWILHCVKKHSSLKNLNCSRDSPVVSLCFALSLLGRRCMGGNQSSKHNLDQFLHGVHEVFAGDINLGSRDDWILADIDLLQSVVTPALRIALKLYQDTFTWTTEYAHDELYLKIAYTEKNVVICRETDPKWRFAVLNDADCLFSFRWVADHTSSDAYRIVQLTKRKLKFRAIKLNPECVRGLWAGQQREQIFLRNNNEERGSIQSANPVLRNLVNSSCDPPIGYPIYVSPLITSFAGDNVHYKQACGGELSISGILLWISNQITAFCLFLRQLCARRTPADQSVELADISSSRPSVPSSSTRRYDSERDYGVSSCWPNLLSSSTSTTKRPSQSGPDHRTTSVALIHQQNDSDNLNDSDLLIHQTSESNRHVRISDVSQILNGHLNTLSWPSKEWRVQCLTYSACQPSVFPGLECQRIHRWTPNNPDLTSRSFCHRTIALLAFPGGPPLLEGRYVAIWEDKGLVEVPDPNFEVPDGSQI